MPDDLSPITPDNIRQVASAQATLQLDSFKESMKLKLEEQEKHILDSLNSKLDERKKMPTPLSTTSENLRLKTPESKKLKRRQTSTYFSEPKSTPKS